jgi:nucleotide-binding universal stress UspA family protein
MASDLPLPTSYDQLDDDVATAVRSASTILVPVDDGGDGSLADARSAAVALGALSGAKVVFLDRADTTYADTPRVFELSPDQVADLDRPYLTAMLDDAAGRGVTATAFQHSLPGAEALTDAAKEVGADLVVVPHEREDPGLLERLKGGDTEDRAADAAPSGTAVVSVDDGGHLRLVR